MTEHTLRLILAPTVTAPRRARHALGAWLDGVDCTSNIRENLLVVISELVTNAVVHARSRSEVLASFDDGRLRLEVHDREHAPPIERGPGDGNPPGGLGLRLVRTLTDSWGWEPTPNGKLVWTETLC